MVGEARKLYNDYILKRESNEELNELRMDFKDGQVLGNDNFLEDIRETYGKKAVQTGSLTVIVNAACEVFGIEKSMLSSLSQSRKLSLRGVQLLCKRGRRRYHWKRLRIFFKRDGSTLSSLRSRFLKKYHECEDLKQQVERLNEKASQLADLQA